MTTSERKSELIVKLLDPRVTVEDLKKINELLEELLNDRHEG